MLSALLSRLSDPAGSAGFSGRVAGAAFGEKLEALLRAGILVEQAPAETWPPCRECDCGAQERPIQRIAGRYLAACPFDSASDDALEQEDLRTFTLDLRVFVAAVFEGARVLAEPLPGLWHSDRRVSGRKLFLTFHPSVVANPALSLAISAHARGPAVLVAPTEQGPAVTRLIEAGIVVVPARDAILLGDRGLPRLDEKAFGGTTRIRLEVRAREHIVLIDGTSQPVPQQPFKLFLMLTRHAIDRRGPVTARDILEVLDREIRDLARELRDALIRDRPNGSEIRDWITTRHGVGYELKLDPDQILLVP